MLQRTLTGVMACAATVLTAPLAAQARPGIEVQLPTATRLTVEGPLVRSRATLSDASIRELLQSGFPARLHYRVELWADGRFFDELQRSVEWDVIVRFRGVEQTYEVAQVVGQRPLALGAFKRVEDAEAAASRPLRVPITAPAEDRRFYYLATLEIETLSVSDLDEVERWLRGELQPAVRGERSPGTALTRGIRSLVTRLLGGDRRQYTQRSPSFRPGADAVR
ncbi:MAG: hypothetical protein OEW77_07635 [Gemmatimonadota bacterium]|nr:hypothetical protein [Gemmatimonadota bacterium]